MAETTADVIRPITHKKATATTLIVFIMSTLNLPENSVAGHKMHHCLFQPVKRQFIHGEDLLESGNGPGITPDILGLRIQPDGMAKGFGQKLHTVDARHRLALVDVNGALRVCEFVGGHAGVAYENQSRVRIFSYEFIYGFRFILALGIKPDMIIDGVMEIIDFEILELRPGIVKEGFNDMYVGVH